MWQMGPSDTDMALPVYCWPFRGVEVQEQEGNRWKTREEQHIAGLDREDRRRTLEDWGTGRCLE